jgi:hypothetical protein
LKQVALLTQSSAVDISELTSVTAAFQKQVTRDFGPLWDVDATVSPFIDLQHVPIGTWPIILVDDDPNLPSTAGGIHLDQNNQPFALVRANADWPLVASHEMLEMLADPFGNRVVEGDSPKPDQGRVNFLVEVCDPSEGADFGYTVNGYLLSDFYTTAYFDPVVADGVRYSFTGAITEPRQVLAGGYLSWQNLETNDWWQAQFFGPSLQFVNLGPLSQSGDSGSLRVQIDRRTHTLALAAMTARKTRLTAAQRTLKQSTLNASQARARQLTERINQLLGKSAGGEQRDTGEGTSRGPAPSPEVPIRRPPRLGRRKSS